MDRPAPDSVEAVIAAGHRFLRFPRAMEAEFQADVMLARKKLLMVCGVIGFLGFLIGSANDPKIMPDIEAMAAPIRRGLGILIFLSLVSVLFIPKSKSKSWHFEAMTSLNTISVCLAIVWATALSREITAMAHSVCMFGLIMYAGIAARQRFVWTCATAAIGFVAYVVFVPAISPLHANLLHTNIKIFELSLACTLLANYTFEHRERSVWLLRKLDAKRRAALVETSERLHELSMRDALTGLYNRRQFEEDMDVAWSTAAFTRTPLSLLSLDVDFFKLYNDSYGHPAGDACLQRVAAILAEVASKQGGKAGRVGGEEFALLLPGRHAQEALLIGQALCEAMRQAALAHKASKIAAHVTISVGVATILPLAGGTRRTLVAMADKALYLAKRNGRDRALAFNVSEGELSALLSEPESQADLGWPMDAAVKAEVVSLPASGTLTAVQLETVVSKGFRWLRFPEAIEAAYQSRNLRARRRHLLISALIGVALFNMFAVTGRAMFPDIVDVAQKAQIGLSALLLTILGLLFLSPKRLVHEAVYALGTSGMGMASVMVLSQSQDLAVYSYIVTLVLIPMFSGIAARQPFWYTCMPAFATVGAAVTMFRSHNAMQALILADSLFMVVNATVYTLIAAYTLEHGERKEWLLEQLEARRYEALTEATDRLHALSMQDPLTGLCNRRQFDLDLDRICADARHDGRPVALLILDIDYFKLYNDGYGHPAGDSCLKQVAQALQQVAAQVKGLAARLGGEEFGILLPGRNEAEALAVGEQACMAVRAANLPHGHSKVARHITVSVGVASLSFGKDCDAHHLLSLADEALYEAKASGRDRARTAQGKVGAAEHLAPVKAYAAGYPLVIG